MDVVFHYEDGTDSELFEHILKISYGKDDKIVEVLEEDLLTHRFPIDETLWLFSDNGVITINSAGLRSIKLMKE